jgi:hypothetical protein
MKPVDAPLFEVQRIDDIWIELADGTRLAGRMWRPATSDPVPAILEYLPYRQGDQTWPRDEPLGSWFAANGYAYVRVDIRGTGNSDGVITDEYSKREHDDGLEVIAWVADQPWCGGAVGMIGISWGGFNGLQIAARRPPALKAVVSMCSTDDRYADDVHYDGGCLLNWDMLPWSAIMFAMNALPPDPRVVGEGWRERWLKRLEGTPPFSIAWLEHQRRDEYWRHGSVCEDYAAIECPVYMVGGWADGYTNAIPRTLAGLPGVRKGLIGPWPHAWPQNAEQGPRIGFLNECRRWFDRWLKGIENGIEDEPMLAAWLQEPALPHELARDRAGRWVRETAWPPSSVEPERRYLGTGVTLQVDPGSSGELTHTGFQRHGLLAGTWCPYGPEADYPPDQREEDALCLTFDTDPLEERLELLGHPVLHLRLAADRPAAFVAARLCAVAPDGTSTLVSRGALNLTHRQGHHASVPVIPGEEMDVDVELDVLGQAFEAGDKLRLAVSTTYWPWLWPSPEPVTITVSTGAASWLELPVRPISAPDGDDPGFRPPEVVPRPDTGPGGDEAFHIIERDVVTGEISMRINQDGDRRARLPNGISLSESSLDRFEIREGDPLASAVTCERSFTWDRDDVHVRIETRSELSSTAVEFLLHERIEVFESDAPVFEGTWDRSIPRDGV